MEVYEKEVKDFIDDFNKTDSNKKIMFSILIDKFNEKFNKS